MEFEWNKEKAAAVEAGRGITMSDVEQAFNDALAYEFSDESNSQDEDRYIVVGMSAKGLLTVAYTVREKGGEEIYRIITAWHSSDREIRLCKQPPA